MGFLFNIHIARLRDELKVVFSKIKEELDDHLESINQNTVEIQSNHEYFLRLTDRIEKLEHRFNELELSVRAGDPVERTLQTLVMTREEEEVFAILLSAFHQKQLISYDEVARRLNITALYCANLVASLLEKGVPIEKRYLAGRPVLELDPDSFEKNVRYNVVTID